MATKRPDAIALLKEDHRKVEGLFEKFEKARDAVAALHQGQDAVRAALQAQVQVRHDALQSAQGLDEVIARLGRLEAAQPDAEVARQCVEPFEQVP